MLNYYAFLSDHSYSLRPVIEENNDLTLNQCKEQNRKRRRSSNRTNEVMPTNNRIVSINRSSSDKENTSIINKSAITHSRNKRRELSNMEVSTESRRTRLSARVAITNARFKSAKEYDNKNSYKIPIKSTPRNIAKKKKVTNNNNNKNEIKLLNSSSMEFNVVLPSLSIEERVKLRRTKPLQLPSVSLKKVKPKINKSKANSSFLIKTSNEKSNKTKMEKSTSTIKNKKLFLGSGLDLDNIVLGNRQRRCVQT